MTNVKKVERILIIEDDPVTRSVLSLAVTRAGHSVQGQMADGTEIRRKIELDPPSLVMLDLDMPHVEGLSILKWLSKEQPHLNTLVLTMLDARAYAWRCRRLGAKGYLQKSHGVELLPMAIERIQMGFQVFPAQLMREKDRLDRYSDVELVALHCLARGGSESTIAMKLQLSNTQARGLCRRLQAKLNYISRDDMPHYARTLGLY